MAQLAFKNEVDELTAKMPAAPDLSADNDAQTAGPSGAGLELDASLRLWTISTTAGIADLRSLLTSASETGDTRTLRYACDHALPPVADRISDLLATLQAGSPAVASSIIEQMGHLRDEAQALIWDFDPDARERDGTAATADDIDVFFNGLAAE